ncbi:hypothetical protein ABZP36_002923 [Zizania latifolia]
MHGWPEVDKRFPWLAVDSILFQSRFGQCIVPEFWEQLSDEGFDAKLQTFFDMVNKNADGQITEEEVKEVLTLTASANKLSKILERVDEYTTLIMEELDPDQLGYIDISNLEALLLLPPS